MHFKGIPSFSPEQFRYINNSNPLKAKQLNKGLQQLIEEGVAQLFTKEASGRKIIGTVGALQFDVIKYRLENEYGASCTYEPVALHKACWLDAEDPQKLQDIIRQRTRDMAKDKDGKWVFLAETAWTLKMAQEKFPEVQFYFTSEF